MSGIHSFLTNDELLRHITISRDNVSSEFMHEVASRFEIILNQRDTLQLALNHERARVAELERRLWVSLDGFKAALNRYNEEKQGVTRMPSHISALIEQATLDVILGRRIKL